MIKLYEKLKSKYKIWRNDLKIQNLEKSSEGISATELCYASSTTGVYIDKQIQKRINSLKEKNLNLETKLNKMEVTN